MSAPTSQDVLDVLRSIDARLGALVAHLGAAAVQTRAQAPARAPTPAAPAPVPAVHSVEIADDRDLDSPYGDEQVRFSPRDWSGPPMKGARMSECPPEFLDRLADTLDYFARKNEETGALTTSGKPKADYDRRAAARARGWAARQRAGWRRLPMDDGFATDDTGSVPGDDRMRADTATDGVMAFDDDVPFTWLLPLLLPVLGAASVVTRVTT